METNNKMREALTAIRDKAVKQYINDNGIDLIWVQDVANTALAEPPRNCDVGTYDEQARRFYAFCQFHRSVIDGMCDGYCPCTGEKDVCHCLTRWMQMPYKKGDVK